MISDYINTIPQEKSTDLTKIRELGSMKKIAFLHIGGWSGCLYILDDKGKTKEIVETRHISLMQKMFPHLAINHRKPISGVCPTRTDPKYRFYQMERNSKAISCLNPPKEWDI